MLSKMYLMVIIIPLYLVPESDQYVTELKVPLIDWSWLEIGEVLGEGASGVVYAGKLKKFNDCINEWTDRCVD